MYSHHQGAVMILGMVTALVLYPGGLLSPVAAGSTPFEQNFAIVYGDDHFKFLDNERTQVQLSLDSLNGAGFGSKVKYESGFFGMDIKLSPKDTAGVVVAFYLRSGDYRSDELDFELLGNREGKDVTVQTNIFANGKGGREQRMVFGIPFRPIKLSDNFHRYEILWNSHIIVMAIDGSPLRVYKNAVGIGVDYPSQPMQVLCTIWNGDNWATDGGITKIDWGHAPFTAEFRGFELQGCVAGQDCHSTTKYWWNRQEHWELDEGGKFFYEASRRHFSYDYCTDTNMYPVAPPECAINRYS